MPWYSDLIRDERVALARVFREQVFNLDDLKHVLQELGKDRVSALQEAGWHIHCVPSDESRVLLVSNLIFGGSADDWDKETIRQKHLCLDIYQGIDFRLPCHLEVIEMIKVHGLLCPKKSINENSWVWFEDECDDNRYRKFGGIAQGQEYVFSSLGSINWPHVAICPVGQLGI